MPPTWTDFLEPTPAPAPAPAPSPAPAPEPRPAPRPNPWGAFVEPVELQLAAPDGAFAFEDPSPLGGPSVLPEGRTLADLFREVPAGSAAATGRLARGLASAGNLLPDFTAPGPNTVRDYAKDAADAAVADAMAKGADWKSALLAADPVYQRAQREIAQQTPPGYDRLVSDATLKAVSQEAAARGAEAQRVGGAAPAIEQGQELLPWVLGAPGVTTAAIEAGGNRRADVLDRGGSETAANVAGVADAAGAIAVPKLVHGLWGPAFEGVGEAVASRLGEPAGRVAEATAGGGATGAGLALESAGISAATGDTERAKAELRSIPSQAATLAILVGGHAGIAEVGRSLAELGAPEQAPAEPPAAAPPATSDELFAKVWSTLTPQTREAVVRAVEAQAKEAGTARVEAVKQEEPSSASSLPTNGAAPTEPAVPAPNPEMTRGQEEEVQAPPEADAGVLTRADAPAVAPDAAAGVAGEQLPAAPAARLRVPIAEGVPLGDAAALRARADAAARGELAAPRPAAEDETRTNAPAVKPKAVGEPGGLEGAKLPPATLRPREPLPEGARRTANGRYAGARAEDAGPVLYRETNPERAVYLVDPSASDAMPYGGGRDVFFANKPELALGQGNNRGVRVEIDSAGLVGDYRSKPGLVGDNREIAIASNLLGESKGNVRAVTLTKEARRDPSQRPMVTRLRRLLEQRVRAEGWTKTVTADGVRYERPAASQEVTDARGGAGVPPRAPAAAAPDHGEPRVSSPTAPAPKPGEPAVVEPRGAAVEPVRGPAAGEVPAERAPAAPAPERQAEPPRVNEPRPAPSAETTRIGRAAAAPAERAPRGGEQAQGERVPGEASSTPESDLNTTRPEVTPRVDESAAAAREDVQAGDERAAMERSGRLPIAPLPAAEGGAAPRAVKPLRDIVRGLADWLGAQTYARRKLQRGAAGYYAPASGGIVLKRAHDLDVAAHEIGHWLDDRFGIMADHLSLEARTSGGPEEEAAAAQREAIASAFDHELRHFWPYGSEPPAHLNAGEARNYLRAEGVAEYLRAWMVNPEAAAKAAPLFTAKFEALVPEAVRNRLREFGDDVRAFHHAPALEAGGANIRQLGETGQPTLRERLAAAWANRGKRDQVAEPLRFGLRDAAAVRFTDELAPVSKAIRWAGEQRGEAGKPAAQRAEMLIRLLAGRDDKATGIARVGMIRADWLKDGKIQLAEGVGGGIDWLGGWVDSRSEETIRRDLHALDSYMVAQKTIETADQIDAERLATINATLAGLKERYKGDAEMLSRKIAQLGRWAARLEARDRARKARLSGQGGGTRPDDEQARRIVAEVANDPVLRARLDEGAKRYRAWADGSLRYLVDKGRMSQESYDEIKAKNQQYVAMHRVMEDLGHPGVSGGGKIGTAKDVVKRRTGSQREIDNPLANLVDNSMRAVFEADRNEAVRSFVDLLRDARRMHQGDAPDLASVGEKVDSAGEGVLTVYRNGTPEYWKLAPELHDAIQGIASAPRLSGLLTLPGKLLHAGVVNNPAFATRNVIRDYLSRLVISQATPQGVLAKIRNLRQQTPIIGRHFDDVEKAMVELAGGAFSGHYMRSKVDWNRAAEKRITDLRADKNTIVVGMKALGRGYLHAIHSSEFAGRAREFHAVFDQLRRQGVDEMSSALMAAKASRDLIDFAQAGRWMRELNQLVPFTNAAIQGLRATGKAIARNPGGVLTRWALTAVLPSAAVWALHVLNGHDDEYRNLPAWRRDLFWNVRVGADTWVSIPKPFELGIGAAGVERGLDAALLHHRGMDADKAIARAYDGWAGSMARGLMPVDAKALLGPYGAIGEVLLDKNLFTGNKIVPDYEEQLPVEQREGTKYASRLGQLGQILSGDSVDARNVDHLIRGFFGGLGGLAETTSDLGRADRSSGEHLLQQASGVLRNGEAEHQVDVKNFLESEAAAGRPQGKAARQIGEFKKAYWQAASGDDREEIAAAMRDYATGRDPLQAFDTAVGAADQFESALKKLPPAAKPAFLAANRDAVLRARALVKANEAIDKGKKRGLSRQQLQDVARRMLDGINRTYPDTVKASR